MTFIKNVFKSKETKAITVPHVIKSKEMIVYLHNGEIYKQTIEDDFYFHEGLQFHILNRDVDDVISYILRASDFVSIPYDNGSKIIIPKTSILKITTGPVLYLRTIRVYSHDE